MPWKVGFSVQMIALRRSYNSGLFSDTQYIALYNMQLANNNNESERI